MDDGSQIKHVSDIIAGRVLQVRCLWLIYYDVDNVSLISHNNI